MKVLAHVIAIALSFSACSDSHAGQPEAARDAAVDAAADAAVDAMVDTPIDATVPDDAAVPVLTEDTTATVLVLTFEQLMIRRCTCDGGSESSCANAWAEQFGNIDKTCVVRAIEQAGVSGCTAIALRELVTCLYGADCDRCAAAELTEDTPLGDTVESCGGNSKSAYITALREMNNCAVLSEG